MGVKFWGLILFLFTTTANAQYEAQYGYSDYNPHLRKKYSVQGVSISSGVTYLSGLKNVGNNSSNYGTNAVFIFELGMPTQYTWESNIFIQPEINLQMHRLYNNLKVSTYDTYTTYIERKNKVQCNLNFNFFIGKKIAINDKMRFILAGGPYLSLFFKFFDTDAKDYKGGYNDEEEEEEYEEYSKLQFIPTRSLEYGEDTHYIKGRNIDLGLGFRTGIEFSHFQLTLGYDHGLQKMYKNMPSVKNRNLKLTFAFLLPFNKDY